MAGRGLVLGVSLLALVGFGCTPETVTPTPPPTTAASASPTETPSETAQEREERLAYAAAEKSYREFRAEYRKVLNEGGATTATASMRDSAGGTYLSEAVDVLKAYRGLEQHSSGSGRVVYVRGIGYSQDSLVLEACEDTREVRIYDKAGKVVGKGEDRLAQIEVRFTDSRWKLWSGRGKKVESCDE